MVTVSLSQQAAPVLYLSGVAERLKDILASLQNSRRPGVIEACKSLKSDIDQAHRDVSVAWGRLRKATEKADASLSPADQKQQLNHLTEAMAYATNSCQYALTVIDRLCIEKGLKQHDGKLFLKIATVLLQ